MQRLLRLVPGIKKELYLATLCKIAESIFMGVPFGIIILALNDLLNHSLTMGKVGLFTASMAVAILLQGFFSYLFNRLAFPAGAKVCRAIRLQIGEKLPTLPMAYYAEKSAGDIASLATDEVTMLSLVPYMAFPQYITAVTLPAVIMPFLFFLDWRMGLVSFLVLPLSMPLLAKCQSILSSGLRRRTASLVAISSHIIEYISGIEVIRGFNLTGERFTRFVDTVGQFKKDTWLLP